MAVRLQHTIVNASAGSGKTYQLANRFIALLLLQGLAGKMAPERLVAVTFTRKGAGEFADRILMRLAGAAAEPKELAKLAADLAVLVNGNEAAGIKGLAPGTKLEVSAAVLQNALAALFDHFDRLVLGTIDSFMSRSVQTLAFELGLGGFEILEEAASDLVRDELLGLVFEEAARKDLAAFYQTLKLATLKSSSGLRGEVDRFVRSYHQLLHALPQSEAWGGSAFWGDLACAEMLQPRPGANWREQAAAARDLVAARDWDPATVGTNLGNALNWICEREPGSAVSGSLPAWIGVKTERGELKRGKLLELWDRWPDNWPCYPRSNSRTPCVVPREIMQPLRRVLEGWLAAECQALSRKTGAIGSILGGFEAVYDRQARRRGKLAFEDLPLLLRGHWDLPGAVSLLGFRWFQQFDHWLLDEFQDTNRAQWTVLKSWIDEAIQDDSGCKSVFVVGDPKQSIYGWRGGEPRLFEELAAGYPGAFHTQYMVESWRSRPAVLELVNRVCGPERNPALSDPKVFAAPALRKWRFRRHIAASKRAGQPGYAAVLAVDPPSAAVEAGDLDDSGAEAGDPMAARARAIRSVLQDLKPAENGLSCAILVRKNTNARAVAQWLRANGVPNVMIEGDATLADQSPVVAALVDALKWLRSPADSLAGQHIQLTPLWQVMSAGLEPAAKPAGPARSGALAAPTAENDAAALRGRTWRHWRLRVAEIGASEVTRGWCEALLEIVREDYARYCLRQVTHAAHRLGPSLALPEWLAALEQLTVRETAAAGSIHIMTIHRAKGLGFDVVFLPDLDLGGGGRDTMLLRRDGDGVPGSCLLCPPKWLRAWVPELEDIKAAAEADQDLEALCVLYVALTRAKEATFVILQKEKPRSSARAREWLLGGIGSPPGQPAPWGEGDLLWEQGRRADLADSGREKAEPSAGAMAPRPSLVLPSPEPRPERRNPSEAGHRAGQAAGPTAFSPAALGQDFGTAVHRVFEQIEWWRPNLSLSGDPSAVDLVGRCLQSDAIRALFTPDSDRDEVCRELPVELLKDNTLWSGIIDRLVLRRDASGNLTTAVLVDFKTDKVRSAAALRTRYAAQLGIYRDGVAAALGLPVGRVAALLVSTHLRECVALE